MSPTLHHESTRVPVTALASCGALLIAAEGPFLRLYHAKSSRYIASRRVFKAQTVHGICVCAELDGVTKIVVWGGRLIRALGINSVTDHHGNEPLAVCMSNVAKASDWILDLAPQMSVLEDEDVYNQCICAAVTAHNALLRLTIQYQNDSTKLSLDVSELTSSSRSILYSAHLLWESSDCILVAAGTAFGEIMYWSWSKPFEGEAVSRIHQVFLGHEGSIFDVRISQRLQRGCCGSLKRVIASCSDDRTIRLWDVSNVDVNVTSIDALDEDTEAQRIRHTGFSIAATEVLSDDTRCLAIGWGHTSRAWKVRFLDTAPCDGALALLSAGEDATSRTWKLVPNIGKDETRPFTLLQTDCAAYHSGRNMWSVTTYQSAAGLLRVACGAADSKLTTHPLLGAHKSSQEQGTTVAEYTLQDLLHLAQPSSMAEETSQPTKVPRKTDSVRSYCFLDDRSFLLVTNHGKVLIQSLSSHPSSGPPSSLTGSTLVDQLDELSGYSTCTGVPAYGIALVAGKWGNIYMYSKHDSTWKNIHKVIGKVNRLFVTEKVYRDGREQLALLVNKVSFKQHELIYIDVDQSSGHAVSDPIHVTVPDTLGGPTVTSMSVVEAGPKDSFLVLGFRRGSVALYDISQKGLYDHPFYANGLEANVYMIIEKVHGEESVTMLKFRALSKNATVGHLYSVGRDGCLAVHMIDLMRNSVQLVHNLALPIGPYIEDFYFHDRHLLVHGFSSKKWVLYDVTSEDEIMGVETGGAHRSWAFQPLSDPQSGGTLVWTRTSSLHICSQKGANHGVLRSGGHGREIKAVAVSSLAEYSAHSMSLVATGAEDTDIKIFQYVDGEPVCRRTLRKHTTGIQQLQWSNDGKHLFSSAGSEEFYIWRIRALPAPLNIGVVCEYVYAPESEFSDLRIMSFDVTRRGSAYTIAMVFSDSSVKTYRYDTSSAPRWQPIAKGIYFTSCLTQCTFLSPTSLLTAGTDGHAVLWPLPPDVSHSSTQALTWEHPVRIHQNASKTMSSHVNSDGTRLIVSGGDDGALAFLLAIPDSSSQRGANISHPVLVNRTHGSAVTACAIVAVGSHTYVFTSGNDEWVRLWEVVVDSTEDRDSSKTDSEKLMVKRLSKVKTSVADVSSMAVLDYDDDNARVLLCGVGMEVIRLSLSPVKARHIE